MHLIQPVSAHGQYHVHHSPSCNLHQVQQQRSHLLFQGGCTEAGGRRSCLLPEQHPSSRGALAPTPGHEHAWGDVAGERSGAALLPPPGLPRSAARGRRCRPSPYRPRGPFLNASVRQRRGEQVPEPRSSLRCSTCGSCSLRRGRANCRLTATRAEGHLNPPPNS